MRFTRFFFLCTSAATFSIKSFAQHSNNSNGGMFVDFHPQIPKLIYATPNNSSGDKLAFKSAIDTSAIKHWMSLENNKVAVSGDGAYFMYNITNQPYQGNTLIVQALSGSWKKELPGVQNGFFTTDNKRFIYYENGEVYFLTLGSNEKDSIANVSDYKLFDEGNVHYLFYRIKNLKDQLILRDIASGKEQVFSNVDEYVYDKSKNVLLLKKYSEPSRQGLTMLELIDLVSFEKKEIWRAMKGQQLMNYTIDWVNSQITTLISDTANDAINPIYSIWYYKEGMNSFKRVLDNETAGIAKNLTLADLSTPGFTKDGRYLCFSLQEKPLPRPKEDAVQVDVWSYRDSIIQSMQLLKIAKNEPILYQAVVSTEKLDSQLPHQIIQLFNQDDEPALEYAQNTAGDFILIRQKLGGDRFWERKVVYKLVSMKDGTSKIIYQSKNEAQFWLSPSGRYLLHFNVDHQYYCYNLETGNKRNISKEIKSNLNLVNPYYKGFDLTWAVGVAGWMQNERYVFVYDNYDIWKMDLNGEDRPINITQGYGVKHNLKIRLIYEGGLFQSTDTLLASAFNAASKYNGIFQITLNHERILGEPVTGPYSIYYSRDISQGATEIFNDFQRPVKAAHANVWVIRKETATEAPNYFSTKDFSSYKPLTNLAPQRTYNWLTSELWEWKKPDATIGQGVLYKPENFDSTKKYPVIIAFYERMSGRLFQYPTPVLPYSTYIQIPWFVSHGYLVFAPDLTYTKGKMVESVCSNIISAAKSLTLLPYVNEKKIGVSSYSWGGVQTNWLVSQSNFFAAVATGGGSMGADPVSTAFQIRESRGVKSESMTEYVEDILGCSLWESPERWLGVSPVLRADKITSPLLMLHNYGEYAWQQDVELFMALRRLNKKVWLLQYDRGSHGLYDEQDIEDFTIRLTQYFDHFLKDAPEPRWMSHGIPAKLKGLELGYETSQQNDSVKAQ